LDLRHISDSTGREFTFDKNSRKSPLAKALDLLRPYAPAGVVPQALPFPTIETWITEVNNRDEGAWDRTEKQLLQITDPDTAKRILERRMGPAMLRRKLTKNRTFKSTKKSNF
jgi:hypothetical protein